VVRPTVQDGQTTHGAKWVCGEKSSTVLVPTKYSINAAFLTTYSTCLTNEKTMFYGPLIQNNPGEPVLSQRRDLLEQPLDFYEPDVLPATQPVVSKHYRKTQWFRPLLFYRHGISTPCLTNSVKALKEVSNYIKPSSNYKNH